MRRDWGRLGRIEMVVEDYSVGVGVGLVVLCCVGRRVDGSGTLLTYYYYFCCFV